MNNESSKICHRRWPQLHCRHPACARKTRHRLPSTTTTCEASCRSRPDRQSRMSSDRILHSPSTRGILAREPHRIGPVKPSGRVISFRHSTKSSPVAGLHTSTVQRHGAVGAGLGLLQAEIASSTGTGRVDVGESRPALAAAAHSCAKAETTLGMRFCLPAAGNTMSKASSPTARSESSLSPSQAAIVGAHVHRQRLRHSAQAARLLAAVDPDLEREHFRFRRGRRTARNRPCGCSIM